MPQSCGRSNLPAEHRNQVTVSLIVAVAMPTLAGRLELPPPPLEIRSPTPPHYEWAGVHRGDESSRTSVIPASGGQVRRDGRATDQSPSERGVPIRPCP